MRYEIPTPPPIEDVAAAVAEQLRRPEIAGAIAPGQRVAIGVGSRGVGRLAEITAALVAGLRALGAEPFVVPAMGSHGGATADGQREVLAGSASPRPASARRSAPTWRPNRSARPTTASRSVSTGRRWPPTRSCSSPGVKPHTAFRGDFESGLAKMVAIGLGKQAGAASCHAAGFGDMARRVPLLAGLTIARTRLRFGLAVLENAYDRPYRIVAVPADRILADEPALLDQARRAMPRVPFEQLDVLLIDRIGKNVSGDGADPNITGRYPTPFAAGGPAVAKQVVLSLTAESEGNANGIGTARLHDRAGGRAGRPRPDVPERADVDGRGADGAADDPAGSDRLALQAGLLTCNAVGRAPRVMRIADTLTLGEFEVSAALLEEVGGIRI